MDNQRLKLELRRARRPFLLWTALVIAGITSLGWALSQQVFQKPWADYVELDATFADAKGVIPKKQDVRVAGVKVGLIKSAELKNGNAVLTLAIEKKHAPIYGDATARLRPQTALQDMYVALSRGHRAAGELRSGDAIRSDHTESPVDVSRVLQTFEADTAERLQFLLAGFGKGLKDRGASLREAFVQVAPLLRAAQRVAGGIAVRRQRLSRLVTSTGRIATEIGTHDRALAGLVRDGNTTFATLARQDVPLDATLRALPGAMASVERSLASVGRARTALDPAIESLRPVAGELKPALGALDRLSADLGPAARALTPAARALTPLAHDLRPLSRDLRAAIEQTAPVAQDLDVITKQIDACHTDIRNFFAYTLSLFKQDTVMSNGGRMPIARGDLLVGPDVVVQGKQRGPAPEDVGKAKPKATRSLVNGGLTRDNTCTERASVSSWPSESGK